MSVSGISSSGFIQQNIATLQNQQQRAQEFQSLAQEFQSGGSAQAQPAETSTQPTPLQELVQPTSATPAQSGSPAAPADPTSGPAPTQNSHLHWHHRLRLPVGSNADSNQSAPTPLFGQLSQPVQSAAAPTAQPGYDSLQQALQQIALNSDLLTAQSAALQASALSVSA